MNFLSYTNAAETYHERIMAQTVSQLLDGDCQTLGQDSATRRVTSSSSEMLIDGLEKVGRGEKAIIPEESRNEILRRRRVPSTAA